MEIGDRVSRTGNTTNLDATVAEIDGKYVLIDYDKGGQGWWPIHSLAGGSTNRITALMRSGDRVSRVENRAVVSATIAEVDGENVLINYDEGGQGWWPLDALVKRTVEPIDEPISRT